MSVCRVVEDDEDKEEEDLVGKRVVGKAGSLDNLVVGDVVMRLCGVVLAL